MNWLRNTALALLALSVWVMLLTRAPPRDPSPDPPDEEPAPSDVGGFGGSNGLTSAKQFAEDQAEFEDIQNASTGLGPVMNSDSCFSCHDNPVTGGGSNVFAELRAGHFDGKRFVPQTATGLIHNRALDPDIQERVFATSERRGLRTATTLLGTGFVECIPSSEILDNARRNGGEVSTVAVLEARGETRVGRFGWRAQHASLMSFSADAYNFEMGVTSTLLPTRNFNPDDPRTFGRPADPVDQGGEQGFGKDVESFARFMRATRPPPRDRRLTESPDVVAGLLLFRKIGCAVCHREEYTTLPPLTRINGNTFTVPTALGAKTIRPFSDFVLHDVGTGDGITQGGPETTANKFRTPPLWGLRVKSRMMHDGLTFTRHEAILRHDGEASGIIGSYKRLSRDEQRQLILFLQSL